MWIIIAYNNITKELTQWFNGIVPRNKKVHYLFIKPDTLQLDDLILRHANSYIGKCIVTVVHNKSVQYLYILTKILSWVIFSLNII